MKKSVLIALIFVVLTIILITTTVLVVYFGRTQHLTVGPKWVNQAQFAGMFIAQERGLYKRQGVDVAFKEFDFETDQLQDLLDGKIDIAVMSAEEVLTAVDSGAPITAVAALYQVSPYVVVTLDQSEIVTPANFQDKRLGNKGGKKEEELFYELLISSVGLTNRDVTIVDLGFNTTELEDLTQGTVDAIGLYRTDQLFAFDREGVEYTIIYPEQYGVNIYNDVLVVHNDFLSNKPNVISRFLKATIQGWELAFVDQEQAIEDTLSYVTNDVYKDKEYQKFILEMSEPLIKPDSNTSIGSMTYASWSRLYKEMHRKGFLKRDFDVNTVYTTELLP